MKGNNFALCAAYGLLAIVSLWTVACDALSRREIAFVQACQRRAAAARADDPLPLTRLAESPFLKRKPREPSLLPAANELLAKSEPTTTARIAPVGVFFLKVSVRTETDSGPRSLPPGTQVRVLRHQGGKLRVTHDGTDFLIEERQLTRDPDAVAALARSTS